MLEELAQDLRFGARTLARQRLFSAAAVLMLALGIGANGAMFALVDAILLRPLPFPAPDRLVEVADRSQASARGVVSPADLAEWNQRTRTFDGIAGFVPNVASMVMANPDGNAETVPRQWVSSGIFTVLGIRPIIGRTFQPSDDDARASLVILSESFWRTRFNADPGIIGRDLRLDGSPWTVVGVVPDEAQIIGRTSMWALSTARFPPSAAPGLRTVRFARAIGRLKPGVSIEAASGDLATIAAALAREYPATNAGRSVTVEPLHDVVVGRELRLTSVLFLAVVGLVLIICCANIANLLMTRATIRRRELAMRAALGAGRARLVRQLLVESVILAAVGGALGVALGSTILRIAPAVTPPDLLPAPFVLVFNVRVLTFCAAATFGVGLLFGLAPAWQATRTPLAQVIASDSRTATGRGGRARASLVVAQVAVAVVLLVASGLLLRTLTNLTSVDTGYRAEGVVTTLVDPVDQRYEGPAGLLRFYEAIEQEIRTQPGVRSVGWATTMPMGESYLGEVFADIVGDPPPVTGGRPMADYQVISPSYLATVDVPLIEGRAFDDRDRDGTTPVCLVNEAFVRRVLGDRPAIGARVALRSTEAADAPPQLREIVGVVRQVKGRADEADEFLQVYVPLAQNTVGDIFLFVRPESGSGHALAPAIRRAFATIDTDQLTSVREMVTLEQVAAEGTSRHRFRALLVITFGTLALVLAMIGVFGVLAYSVEQRVRDFGVRRALGATTGDVLRVVVRSAGVMIGAGTLVGLALAAGAGRLLASLLFGVEPLDLPTFGAVAATLAATAVVASLAPAWRATWIDPVLALRAE